MSPKSFSVILCLWVSLGLYSQAISLTDTGKSQYNLNRIGLPHGNFSGISMIDDSTYAVVSDRDVKEGFHLWNIRWQGTVPSHIEDRFIESDGESRDAEAIVYHPSTKTVFISAESDQRIREYDLGGRPTGRELNIPRLFWTDRIQPNGGFESLAYNANTGLFWTCTELPLRDEDGIIHFQSFGEDMMPKEAHLYQLDEDEPARKWRNFVHGIAEVCALDDGSLLVLERTVAIKRLYLGSFCEMKIYSVRPTRGQERLEKTLVKSFRTPLNLGNWIGKTRFANYEGMCIGPEIDGSSRIFLIINDSQNGLRGLKEYIKTFIYAY